MPSLLPPHIISFQKFEEQIPDHLTASVAFGMFMQSERAWVDGHDSEPTDTKCRNYHRDYLTTFEIDRHKQSAEALLNEFANGVVGTKRADFLQQSITQYQTAASAGHRGFRFWGITEAAAGALVWALLLIACSVIAARNGIDIVEAYHKASGINLHNQAVPKP